MGILRTLVLPSSSSPFREVASALGSCHITSHVSVQFIISHSGQRTKAVVTKVRAHLARFIVVFLVFSFFFVSRYMIGSIISKTEIQQQNQRRKDNSQNNLGENIIMVFIPNTEVFCIRL